MSFISLPVELILAVVEALPLSDGLSLSSTCSRLYQVIPRHTPTHLHFNLLDDIDSSISQLSSDPETRIIFWKDIKKLYEVILCQGFNGPILQGLTKLTFTVSDSIYKIPLIKPPTQPSQVNRYPANFLALSLINNIIPTHCRGNIRYVGVHVKKFKTCPKFIFGVINALHDKAMEVNVYTSGEQLPIPSRKKLNATHLTLAVEDYAMVPAFINRHTVKTLTLDCSQKVVDMNRLLLVFTKLTKLEKVRIRAKILKQDVLRMLPDTVKQVDLDVKRINELMEEEYPKIEALSITHDSDIRLKYTAFPDLQQLCCPFESSMWMETVTTLNTDCAFLDHLAMVEDEYEWSNLQQLVISSNYFGSELTNVHKCPNLVQLMCVCSKSEPGIFTQVLLSSRSLISLCVYSSNMRPTIDIYTGKVLTVTNSSQRFEQLMGVPDDTYFTTKFRPSWQPKTKRRTSSTRTMLA